MKFCYNSGVKIKLRPILGFATRAIANRRCKLSQIGNQLTIKPIAQIHCKCYMMLFFFLFVALLLNTFVCRFRLVINTSQTRININRIHKNIRQIAINTSQTIININRTSINTNAELICITTKRICIIATAINRNWLGSFMF